ncbi:MAG: hypothetical protein L3J14_06695 [Flavobacteriaceae bacterium]|nr:hypothetical protein [Flavobacteriaceae bacterium]
MPKLLLISIDMGYTLNILGKKAFITFDDTAEENEITNAFLEVVDIINIRKLNYIIFDCTNVINYAVPADHMARVKVVTHFSTAWNANITIIFIATNSEIRFMATAFINHNEDLKWNYMLFEDLNETLKWCDKNE